MAMQKLIYKARSRGQKTEADQAQREIDRLRARLADYERDLIDEHTGSDRSQDTDWLRAAFLQSNREIERLENLVEQYERATIKRDESVPNWASMWVKGIDGRCEYVGILGDTSEAQDFRPDAAGPLMQPIVDVE